MWGGVFIVVIDVVYFVFIVDRNMFVLDVVEIGCVICEKNQCDIIVGYGGLLDEFCEIIFDVMVMDGIFMKIGVVVGLWRIKDVIGVVCVVLEYIRYLFFVGDLVINFVIENGFKEQDLMIEVSKEKCEVWKRVNCQLNYRLNVVFDLRILCGFYMLLFGIDQQILVRLVMEDEGVVLYDIIFMVVIYELGIMVVGILINGVLYKVFGRVGDGLIVGSGFYVDGDVGGCGVIGDGDIMMCFLFCYQVIENLRQGMSLQDVVEDVVVRMLCKYFNMLSGIVVVNIKGEYGGVGLGWIFIYLFWGGDMEVIEVVLVLLFLRRFEE